MSCQGDLLDLKQVVTDEIASLDYLVGTGAVSRACIIGKGGDVKAASPGYEVSFYFFQTSSCRRGLIRQLSDRERGAITNSVFQEWNLSEG
jgi:hypothetical protein